MSDPATWGAAWREAPAPTPAEPPGPLDVATRWVFAVVVATLGPLVRSMFLGSQLTEPWRVGIIVAAASVASGLCGERRWWLRGLIAVAGAGALVRSEGELVAIWAGAGIVLGDWAVRRWSPAPGIPRASSGAVIPVTVLLGIAAWEGRDFTPGLFPLLFVALALVVTAVGAFSDGALDSLMSRFGRAVGQGVSWLAFAFVAIPLVVLPWAGYRLARVDPLAQIARTGWAGRRMTDPQPSKMWSIEPLAAPRAWMSRWQRMRASAVVAALLVPFAVVTWRAGQSGVETVERVSTENALVRPAAYADDEWYQAYRDEIDWITHPKVAWNPLHDVRIADVESRYVNVTKGVRESWSAPPCDCRRVSVWMYGGSTTFGLGQRDEYTIASELARIAWADGYAVDVENRGSLGDLHWGEAHRFAWDLTDAEAPDIVMFYDGVNELWSAYGLSNEDLGDIDRPYEPFREDMWLQLLEEEESEPPARPEGARVVRRGPGFPGGPLDAQAIGELSASRYDRSRGMSRDTAAQHDIDIHWFWQPSRFSRPPIDAEGLEGPAVNGTWDRDTFTANEASVPDGVHDVTGALDGSDEPMFIDDVHHNESGARLIAEAMYPFVRADIARTAAEGESEDQR